MTYRFLHLYFAALSGAPVVVVRGDAPAVVRCDAPAVIVRCDAPAV